jgi:ribosome production factor 1
MASSKSAGMPTGIKPKNKMRRQDMYLKVRKLKEAQKRDERFKRRREEAKDPSLRQERLANNVPVTIDGKRTWDEPLGDVEDEALGWAVDVERLAKKRKLEQEVAEQAEREGEGLLEKLKQRDEEDEEEEDDEEEDEEIDSMLDSDSDSEADDSDNDASQSKKKRKPDPPKRASSPASTTATNLELSPEFLKQKFPSLFEQPAETKILITTSINSTLHSEARILESFFPNSSYIRRTAHAHVSIWYNHPFEIFTKCAFLFRHTNTAFEKLQNLPRHANTLVSSS